MARTFKKDVLALVNGSSKNKSLQFYSVVLNPTTYQIGVFLNKIIRLESKEPILMYENERNFNVGTPQWKIPPTKTYILTSNQQRRKFSQNIFHNINCTNNLAIINFPLFATWAYWPCLQYQLNDITTIRCKIRIYNHLRNLLYFNLFHNNNLYHCRDNEKQYALYWLFYSIFANKYSIDLGSIDLVAKYIFLNGFKTNMAWFKKNVVNIDEFKDFDSIEKIKNYFFNNKQEILFRFEDTPSLNSI